MCACGYLNGIRYPSIRLYQYNTSDVQGDFFTIKYSVDLSVPMPRVIRFIYFFNKQYNCFLYFIRINDMHTSVLIFKYLPVAYRQRIHRAMRCLACSNNQQTTLSIVLLIKSKNNYLFDPTTCILGKMFCFML